MSIGLGKLGASFGSLGNVGFGSGITFPRITLSNLIVSETASIGDPVGDLGISGSFTGTPVFALDNDASGKYDLDGITVEVAAALANGTDVIVVSVSGIAPAINPQTFLITVTDVTSLGDTFWAPRFYTPHFFPIRFFG